MLPVIFWDFNQNCVKYTNYEKNWYLYNFESSYPEIKDVSIYSVIHRSLYWSRTFLFTSSCKYLLSYCGFILPYGLIAEAWVNAASQSADLQQLLAHFCVELFIPQILVAAPSGLRSFPRTGQRASAWLRQPWPSCCPTPQCVPRCHQAPPPRVPCSVAPLSLQFLLLQDLESSIPSWLGHPELQCRSPLPGMGLCWASVPRTVN